MRNIVLIKRENTERVTHVSVFLCGNSHDAVKLCRLVNGFFVNSDEKLTAACISMGKEYTLEKKQEFTFDDFIKVDDRIIQRIFRELDPEILGEALLGSGEAVKEHFFKNMSQRAAGL
jgi:flagellar motor switch protein FliG